MDLIIDIIEKFGVIYVDFCEMLVEEILGVYEDMDFIYEVIGFFKYVI